jgi:two-component system sensor histidine kinase PilS (NtrC family)
MSQTALVSKFPLPEALTHRIISYLSVFRLLICLILLYALLSELEITPLVLNKQTIGATALLSYFVMAVFLTIDTLRKTTRPYAIAVATLFTDILFLSVLLFIFGRLESGLTILLIFTSASAAILLPLQVALFFASLVVLAFISGALVGFLTGEETTTALVQAGIYGVTTFTIAILVNLVSRWLKDYRLIAERQAAQLTRLEQVNELVIRRMRNGVLAVDADGRIQLMNESAWFLLGSPKADQRILAKISPQLDKALTNWYDNPSIEIAPMTLYGSQARVVPKFVSLPGISNIRVLIFLEDNEVISQRAVEMSAHMLANLSGSIAHEIRNPLAAINHAAQLLAESEEIAQSDARLVDIIHSQAGRMNGIVENILQLSRHEKSRPDIFELVPFLNALSAETKSSLPGIRLTLEINPEEEGTLVLFDRSQLHQAVWKLLENANRHARLDAAMPQVVLSMKHLAKTGYCIITVEDNGPGIPEANMKRIFDPFFTTHKQGSGLGLYIARQLCDVNQAELTVDSVLGSYSRFHIRLALARSERKKEGISAPKAQAALH